MDEEPKLTLYEEDFYAKKETKEKNIQMVVFRVSSEWYAVEIADVREVVNFEKITFLPSMPEHIAGIFNLRGNILSVTDLRKVFGLSQEAPAARSKLVVIQSGILETALLADEMAEPLEVSAAQIDPTLSTIALDKAEYLSGTCNIDRKFIGILRTEKILQVQRKA